MDPVTASLVAILAKYVEIISWPILLTIAFWVGNKIVKFVNNQTAIIRKTEELAKVTNGIKTTMDEVQAKTLSHLNESMDKLAEAAVNQVEIIKAVKAEHLMTAERTKEVQELAADVKNTVDAIKNNHLHRLNEGIAALSVLINKQVELLMSISTNIAIMVDRTPRQIPPNIS